MRDTHSAGTVRLYHSSRCFRRRIDKAERERERAGTLDYWVYWAAPADMETINNEIYKTWVEVHKQESCKSRRDGGQSFY